MTEELVRPRFDPELAAALAMAKDVALATITPEMIGLLRQILAEQQRLAETQLRENGSIDLEEHRAPGPPGAPDISLLVSRPRGLRAPSAAIYVTHGGGMIAGSNRLGILEFVEWAVEFGAVVVSVEYRLAPEHPDPAPTEDCYAGLIWTAANANALRIDSRRLIVAGASAGGGLAAAMALMARDRIGPALIGQMLLCPMLDDRRSTPSSKMLNGEGVWDRTANLTGWTALLGHRQGGASVSHYAAPARAVDLSNLPPAFIDVGSVEVFRDEAVNYASRIWQAGGSAELHVWPGGYHGFDSLAPTAAVSRASRSTRTDWVRRLLESQDGLTPG